MDTLKGARKNSLLGLEVVVGEKNVQSTTTTTEHKD
jgi:hypothetical protein